MLYVTSRNMWASHMQSCDELFIWFFLLKHNIGWFLSFWDGMMGHIRFENCCYLEYSTGKFELNSPIHTKKLRKLIYIWLYMVDHMPSGDHWACAHINVLTLNLFWAKYLKVHKKHLWICSDIFLSEHANWQWNKPQFGYNFRS